MTKRQRNGLASFLALIFIMQAFAHPPLFGWLVLAILWAIASYQLITEEK